MLGMQWGFSQEKEKTIEKNDSLKYKTEEVAVKKKKRRRKKKEFPYEPLAPARAAFYSALLPGLGQAYSKKYWKIPIIYAALGTSIYAYKWNNDIYNRFRDVYKARLSGVDPNTLEFPSLTNEGLIERQRTYRRDQELSILITVGLYVLNIVDANVSAHLQQYNISKDLSFRPKINIDQFNARPNYGMTLNYSF